MRFLTFSNCPLDDALGSGYVALRYAAGLRARGHQVDLRGPADYEIGHGLSRRAIRHRQALGMAFASLSGLLAAEYDIVEFYGGEAWLALCLLARWPGRRFLLACHSNGLETHCEEVLRAAAPGESTGQWYHLSLGALAEQGFRQADAILTVAEYDRAYALRRAYLPADRVLAIENPLPDSFLGLPLHLERPPVLGFCGSWLPRKGSALLTRDIPGLLRELPEWRFVLVGVGDRFRAAEHFPGDLLPRIEVIPYAERETALRALYQTFSIFLLPSVYESFGLTAAEAMACGCALVATPVGFAAGLRQGEEAMLLSATEPSLVEPVLALARDPGLRQRIARGGHRRVQTLGWDGAITTAETAYATWLAELRGNAP